MLSLIQGLVVAPSQRGLGHVTLAVCLYQGGCLRGEINVKELKGRRTQGMHKSMSRISKVCKTLRYDLVRFSPSYASDRTLFYICGERLLRSRDDGQTWTNVKLPALAAANHDASASGARARASRPTNPMPHDLVFSPAYASDRTVFVAGFNLGIAKSVDAGQTFVAVWGRA